VFIGIAVMMACDPMEDVYKELDKNPTAISADLDIVLEDDDYELSGIESAAKYGSFSNIDDAKEGIPNILTDKYPHLGEGSSAIVGYKLYVGSPEGLSDYTYADEYKVSEADYYSVSTEVGDAGFFNNTSKAEDNVPGILATNIVDPEDGKKVAVSSKYADKEYEDISGVTIYEEDFESYVVPDLGALQTFSIVGAQEWVSYSSSSGYQAGNMSGYSYPDNVPNEDWMVLPEIDLDGYSKAELKLNQVLNYLGEGVVGTDIAVKISTDYDGADPLTATWVNLDFDQFPAGDEWDAVESKVSLEDYADQKIFIAFYYKSTVDFAANWRLISVVVEEGEAVATDTKNVFYEYDATSTSWSAAGDEVYYLASSDYDAMGSPGRYNNFSSSDPASNYLPQMLSAMFPYAQEEDQLFVIYRYYSSSAGETQTRGDLYTYSLNTWSYAPSTIETVMQLGMNGTIWEPDNTIKYEMTSDDYTAVSEAYATKNPDGSASMDQYGNYDTRIWSDEEILESIGGVLLSNFPGSEEGQKYLVSYKVYTGSAGETRTLHVILSGGEYVPVGSE